MVEQNFSLNSKIPDGALKDKWEHYLSNTKRVSPGNRNKLEIIICGGGLAGSYAASSLAEQGYKVRIFFFHDTSRRAHSVAAQGGVNAMKDYTNEGDTEFQFFKDTLKGGDFRSREANVYRLAQLSGKLIDHCVAQGVPFAREYGGLLANRSFGGVQVSRTFYARGQTGQQLLLGAYGQLQANISKGHVLQHSREELVDIIVYDGRATGIVTRHVLTGEIHCYSSHAVVMATGGYGRIYWYSTLATQCNASGVVKAYKKGALLANPSFIQFHPTSLPPLSEHQSKLVLMSEGLRNDGRIWVPKNSEETRTPSLIPEDDRDYYLERQFPAYGNLTPRDLASRAALRQINSGHGVGALKQAVYLDFSTSLKNHGEQYLRERYANLFDLYQTVTGTDPLTVPMQIAPAAHFTMGGLWVDYELSTSIPGLYAIGECNFSDHGANRLGANSLLQASVDGLFILPKTIGQYLSSSISKRTLEVNHQVFKKSVADFKNHINALKGRPKREITTQQYFAQLGKILRQSCGPIRSEISLKVGLREIEQLYEQFKYDLILPKNIDGYDEELQKAIRLDDYFYMAKIMCKDALTRNESAGAHFREEFEDNEGQGVRDDQNFAHVSAWKYEGPEKEKIFKEKLKFEYLEPSVRSYK